MSESESLLNYPLGIEYPMIWFWNESCLNFPSSIFFSSLFISLMPISSDYSMCMLRYLLVRMNLSAISWSSLSRSSSSLLFSRICWFLCSFRFSSTAAYLAWSWRSGLFGFFTCCWLKSGPYASAPAISLFHLTPAIRFCKSLNYWSYSSWYCYYFASFSNSSDSDLLSPVQIEHDYLLPIPVFDQIKLVITCRFKQSNNG